MKWATTTRTAQHEDNLSDIMADTPAHRRPFGGRSRLGQGSLELQRPGDGVFSRCYPFTEGAIAFPLILIRMCLNDLMACAYTLSIWQHALHTLLYKKTGYIITYPATHDASHLTRGSA